MILLIDNYASSATYHFVEDIVYSNFDTSNISITSIEWGNYEKEIVHH